MKAFSYILILFLTLVLGGCKHEIIPAPTSNNPVFGVEGTLSEVAFSVVAGMENTIMTPSIVETDGIKIYKGVLGNDQSYFQLEIYNGNIDFPSQPKFDPDSFQEIRFTPSNQGVLWSVNKSDFPNSGSITKIIWNVNGVDQVLPDDLKIYKPGKYDVCAKVTFENQTESTLCRQISVGFKKNADFILTHQVISASKLTASVVGEISTISSVNWFLDGNLISDSIQLERNLPIGKYLLRSEVTFTNGIVLNRSAIVDVSWAGNGIDDFSMFATETNDFWDYKAKITYFKGGKTYSSLNDYNADKFISVEELDYHGVDASGFPVYTLKGMVDAILLDENNQTASLKAKIAIGFSIK